MSQHAGGPAGQTQFIEPRLDPPNSGRSRPAPKSSGSASSSEDGVQANRPVPTMGMPAVLHRAVRLVNPKSKPPRLSNKETRLRAQQEHQAERDRIRSTSIRRLRELANEVPTTTAAFVGIKGGAATTTTMVHASSVTADITRTILFAADFNPASGTAGARLGKDYNETLTLRELREIADTIHEPSDLLPLLRPTRYGVRVLSANDYTLETSQIFGTHAEKMLELLQRYCDYLFVDTANDISTTSSVQVLRAADVIIFTANAASKESLIQLGTSMQTVRQLAMTDKVSNSIVLISNLPAGAQLEDYRKYTHRVNTHDQVVQQYDFVGPFLQVPNDPVIGEGMEVDLEALGWETYQSFLDLSIVILEQAQIANKFAPVPGTHSLRKEK